MDTVTLMVLIACAAVIVLVLAAVLFYQRRHSRGLRDGFGPEYDRTVRQTGASNKAEHELEVRRKRVEALGIRSLSPDQCESFSGQWREVQARFVDEPMEAIGSADRLLNEVMMARGYPVGDFERRVEDLSVDHGPVMAKYRKAHGIATARDAGVEPETEQVRQAFVSYRDVFDDLLGTGANGAEPDDVPLAKREDDAASRGRPRPSMQH
jgi:hypothetical protein